MLFKSAPDFENPGLLQKQSYTLAGTATDDAGQNTMGLNVIVKDVNEGGGIGQKSDNTPPTITGNNGKQNSGTSLTTSDKVSDFVENSTGSIIDLKVNEDVTWEIDEAKYSSQNDGSLFTVNASGSFFKQFWNFENKLSKSKSSIYNAFVSATDLSCNKSLYWLKLMYRIS